MQLDYSYLDKDEYSDIPIFRIEQNRNGLPFFIARLNKTPGGRLHRHEYVQIEYVAKGRLKHQINRNCFDVYKGDIFVIPPFVPHIFLDSYTGESEVIEFEFVPEFINEKFSLEYSTSSFLKLHSVQFTGAESRKNRNLSSSFSEAGRLPET